MKAPIGSAAILVLALAAGALSAGEAPTNTIRWKTASEVDNFGFLVYRSELRDGPFQRITDSPIAGAGTTDVPQEYVFTDDSIEPCKEYWYYVESISLRGEIEVFTPKLKVGPKPSEEMESCAHR